MVDYRSDKLKIKLKLKWDLENSSWFISQLLKSVEKDGSKMKISAKPGSIELVISIIALSVEIARWIEDEIRHRRDKNEELSPVTIIINKIEERVI
ncbi:MAG: hypothetical protein ISS48_00505 [Candidatus Aenigmarchaeota archaeon]|nr:hypothetical protein [Candidatus Aenigmarchaeota archaeon]